MQCNDSFQTTSCDQGGSVVLNCTIEDFGRPSVTSYVWWEGESEVLIKALVNHKSKITFSYI